MDQTTKPFQSKSTASPNIEGLSGLRFVSGGQELQLKEETT